MRVQPTTYAYTCKHVYILSSLGHVFPTCMYTHQNDCILKFSTFADDQFNAYNDRKFYHFLSWSPQYVNIHWNIWVQFHCHVWELTTACFVYWAHAHTHTHTDDGDQHTACFFSRSYMHFRNSLTGLVLNDGVSNSFPLLFLVFVLSTMCKGLVNLLLGYLTT